MSRFSGQSITVLTTSLLLAVVPATLMVSGTATAVQQPDVRVKGPTVKCKKVGTKVSAPRVGVSFPNPSKLVPNVGGMLRKGVGVPAPDSNAPNVKVPKVSANSPNANCAKS